MSPLVIVPFATLYPLQKYLRGTCFSKKRLFQVDSIMISKTLAANLLHRSFYCPKFAAYGSMGHRRHSLPCCKAVHLIFFAAVLQKRDFQCGAVETYWKMLVLWRCVGFRVLGVQPPSGQGQRHSSPSAPWQIPPWPSFNLHQSNGT